jgi:hypothetical protein
MQEINCNLENFKVISGKASLDGNHKGRIALEVNEKIRFRMPADPNNNSGLIDLIISIQGKDCRELNIEIGSRAVFRFDCKPDDFEKVMSEKCLPVAKSAVYQAIKRITEDMGYSPIDLTSLKSKDTNAE